MKHFLLFFSFFIGSFIHAQQFKSHYEVFGEGYPVLLINGGPGFSSEGFRKLADKLSINNKVIIYDQRGTGQSPLETLTIKNITLDLMISDIENLRTELGYETWIVMGHSFGGMLGSYYASKYPERINGLILSSSGGLDLSLLGNTSINSRLSSTEQDSLRYWNRAIAQGDTSANARLKRATFLAPAYLENKDFVPQVAERLTQGSLELNGMVWQDMRSRNYDVKNEMKNFHKPVLILHGKHDVVNPESAVTASNIFPSAKLVMLDKSSHYGWLDQPDLYFAKIFEFLEQFS